MTTSPTSGFAPRPAGLRDLRKANREYLPYLFQTFVSLCAQCASRSKSAQKARLQNGMSEYSGWSPSPNSGLSEISAILEITCRAVGQAAAPSRYLCQKVFQSRFASIPLRFRTESSVRRFKAAVKWFRRGLAVPQDNIAYWNKH